MAVKTPSIGRLISSVGKTCLKKLRKMRRRLLSDPAVKMAPEIPSEEQDDESKWESGSIGTAVTWCGWEEEERSESDDNVENEALERMISSMFAS